MRERVWSHSATIVNLLVNNSITILLTIVLLLLRERLSRGDSSGMRGHMLSKVLSLVTLLSSYTHMPVTLYMVNKWKIYYHSAFESPCNLEMQSHPSAEEAEG